MFKTFAQQLCYHTSSTQIQKATLDSVEHIIVQVATHIDNVNVRLTLTLDDMKPMFQKSVQQISKLLAIDPNLLEQATIPSNPISFVLTKERLMDAKEELRQCVLQFEQEITTSASQPEAVIASWIPPHLVSSQAYRRSATIQTMTVVFVLQCLGIVGTFFWLSIYMPFDDEALAETGSNYIIESLSSGFRALGDYLSVDLSAFVTAIGEYEPASEHLTVVTTTWILTYAVVSYLITNIVLGMTYLTGQTSNKKMLRVINNLRQEASDQTNLLLKQYGIIFLCQDILQTRVRNAKVKLLKLIHTQLKLEMLWGIVDQQLPPERPVTPTRVAQRLPAPIPPPTTPVSPKPTFPGDSIVERLSRPFATWRASGQSTKSTEQQPDHYIDGKPQEKVQLFLGPNSSYENSSQPSRASSSTKQGVLLRRTSSEWSDPNAAKQFSENATTTRNSTEDWSEDQYTISKLGVDSGGRVGSINGIGTSFRSDDTMDSTAAVADSGRMKLN